nr:unnamed protein product [Naegleria fowleri]
MQPRINFHYLEVKKPGKQAFIFASVSAGAYLVTQLSKTVFGLPSTTPNNDHEMIQFYRPIDQRETWSFDFTSIAPPRPKRED